MLRGKLLAASGQPIKYVGGSGAWIASGTGAFSVLAAPLNNAPIGTAPAGKAGDLSIVAIGLYPSSTSGLPTDITLTCDTAGYVLLASTYMQYPNPSGTPPTLPSPGGARLDIFGKFLTEDQADGSYINFTKGGISTADFGYSMLSVWRNTKAFDAVATTAYGQLPSAVDAPAITTVTNDTVILITGFYANAGNQAFDLFIPNNFFTVTTSDQTEYGSMAYIPLSAAQTYNPPNFFLNAAASTSDTWCAATIALRKSSN